MKSYLIRKLQIEKSSLTRKQKNTAMPSWMVNPGLLKSRGLDVQVTSLKVDSRNSLSSSTQHTIFSFS